MHKASLFQLTLEAAGNERRKSDTNQMKKVK